MENHTKAMQFDILAKHAKRFGPEAVMETAVSLGLSFEDLVRLQTLVDEIEKKQRRGQIPRRRLSVEERVKRLLGISDEEEEATAT